MKSQMAVKFRARSRQVLLYLLVFIHVAAVYVRCVGWAAEHLYDGVEVIPEGRERGEGRHDAHALTLREVFRHDDVRDVLTKGRHAP